MLFRQVVLLEAALHESHPGPAAGAESEQRSPKLVAALLAGLFRAQERRDPHQPHRVEKKHIQPRQHHQRTGNHQIIPAKPGHHRDRHRNAQHQRGGPEVAPGENPADDRSGDADHRQDAAAAAQVVERPDILRTVFRHEKGDRDLGQFRRLGPHTDSGNDDPPVRTLDRRREKRHCEQQKHDRHQRQAPRCEFAVSDHKSDDAARAADRRPDELAPEIPVTVRSVTGRVKHGQSEHDDQRHDGQETKHRIHRCGALPRIELHRNGGLFIQKKAPQGHVALLQSQFRAADDFGDAARFHKRGGILVVKHSER
ncbi:hypothetical protein SDC9_120458 [bioreactor metagenome]|uniref:Uncharacterized protein n=1 Tax=bioreactor metagenome TaxID=1076179 RepID=A0A645C7T4_9ZZZZ